MSFNLLIGFLFLCLSFQIRSKFLHGNLIGTWSCRSRICSCRYSIAAQEVVLISSTCTSCFSQGKSIGRFSSQGFWAPSMAVWRRHPILCYQIWEIRLHRCTQLLSLHEPVSLFHLLFISINQILTHAFAISFTLLFTIAMISIVDH